MLAVIDAICSWYDAHRRDLPWRHSDAWGVLVSEIMLQQTPVARVLPVWHEWMSRWPDPAALAAQPSSAAVAAWGRLGYPRRALRLHETARAICERHDGTVPAHYDELIALPGVGDYTASAVASFAFGTARPVLDTNVRRLLDRVELGRGAAAPSITKSERLRAWAWTNAAGERAATWAAAAMEFGQLVCQSRSPQCETCPIADRCAWLRAGRPAPATRPRTQAWEGTDRQCRGRLLDVVRRTHAVAVEDLIGSWHDPEQATRCLAALVADGLVHAESGEVTL